MTSCFPLLLDGHIRFPPPPAYPMVSCPQPGVVLRCVCVCVCVASVLRVCVKSKGFCTGSQCVCVCCVRRPERGSCLCQLSHPSPILALSNPFLFFFLLPPPFLTLCFLIYLFFSPPPSLSYLRILATTDFDLCKNSLGPA